MASALQKQNENIFISAPLHYKNETLGNADGSSVITFRARRISITSRRPPEMTSQNAIATANEMWMIIVATCEPN
jgi:hypothetical protein